MKIHKVCSNIGSFKADREHVNRNGEYIDPLMHWPLRGCAFTNEVGEALRPLIGEYATLSWAPALLYIGADVYDKYKNNKTEFSPNSERCLKQAIFQGLASILLPIIAVKSGQKLFSQFGRFTHDKITYNNKERIAAIAKEFVANGKMHAFKGKDAECKKEFLEIIKNKLEFKRHASSTKNPIKKFGYYINDKISKLTHSNTKDNINNYAAKKIELMIDMRKKMISPSNEDKSNKWFQNYEASLKQGQTSNVAIKSALTKNIDSEMMTGKTVKTIGGFIALGIAINPIDRFVENVLIGKVVNNGIEKYYSSTKQ